MERNEAKTIQKTIDEYAVQIDHIFNGTFKATVPDLYIVAVYTKFFEANIDKDFASYTKEEDNQRKTTKEAKVKLCYMPDVLAGWIQMGERQAR